MKGTTNRTQKDDFPHTLRWDKLGRKGQCCKILRNSDTHAHIKFEDGFTAIVERRALTRKRA
jgi:hypothetical protein